MKFSKKFFLFYVYLIIFSLFNVSAYADADTWHFILAPYVWFTWDTGHLTTLNRKIDIDLTPKAITNALDSGFQLHFEANKGRVTWLVDPTYLEMSGSSRGALGTTTIKYKQALVDFGGFYRFNSYLINNSNSRLDVEGFLGGRYWYLESKILPPLSRAFTGDKKWLDPVVGGRLLYHIKDNWLFSLNGNIRGLNLISKFTWQLKAIALYNFNRYFGIGAGFQALYIDYKDGKGLTEFHLRKTTYGPMVGLVFSF